MIPPDPFRSDISEILRRQAAAQLEEQRKQDERRARVAKMPRVFRFAASVWFELARPAPIAALIVWLTGAITGAAITLLIVHDKIH